MPTLKEKVMRAIERISGHMEEVSGYLEDIEVALNSDEYEKKNPLGGPAKMFDAIAERIRAGEEYWSVLADYGVTFESRGREHAGDEGTTATSTKAALPEQVAPAPSPSLDELRALVDLIRGKYRTDGWQMSPAWIKERTADVALIAALESALAASQAEAQQITEGVQYWGGMAGIGGFHPVEVAKRLHAELGHQITVAADMKQHAAEWEAEVERLRGELAVDRMVCVCGCLPGDHEIYDDGEGCGHDDHECIRTCPAIRTMVVSLRAEVERLRARLFTCRQSETGHSTACSIWGDDGRGGTAEGFKEPLPCNCGYLIAWERKRAEAAERERDEASKELAVIKRTVAFQEEKYLAEHGTWGNCKWHRQTRELEATLARLREPLTDEECDALDKVSECEADARSAIRVVVREFLRPRGV